MHPKPPKVSIGLPVFNGERYIAEALDSILSQDFTDFEILISDNASTDATEKICRDYAEQDSRIQYHRMVENIGAARNYNHVFEMSKGTYFKWAAHDDVMLPGYLSACLNEFERHENTSNPPSIVHTKSMMIDENGSVFKGDSIIFLTDNRPAVRIFMLLPRLGANAVFGLVRRKTLERTRLIGSFPASDYVLLVELALIGPIIQVDKVFFHRRVHSGMSNRANSDSQSLLAWFDPQAKSQRTDNIRHFGEYFRSVWKSDALGALSRAACLTTLSVAVALKASRLLRVELGRRRRNLIDQIVRSRASHQR